MNAEYARFLRWTVPALLLAVSLLPADGRAQGKPTPAAAGAAHVRLWKTELKDFAGLRVTFKTDGGRHATIRELGGGGPGYSFGEYLDLPAARGVFELFAGSDKHALASLPASLAPESCTTVLLSEPARAGAGPSMELIDSGDASPTAPAQITVRNFVTDLKEARVTFGDKLNAQFDAGASFLLMRGIAPAVYRVRTTGTSKNGEPFEWTNEIDLRRYRRQTLLIYPDPYGRVRPRVSIDNEPAPPESEKKDGQR